MSQNKVIYARNTTVQSMEFDEAAQFVDEYHRQGMNKQVPLPHCYGLYHNDELVGTAIFSAPRTRAKQRMYAYELLRMCFKGNIRVVGGASKLIKFFIADKNPPNFFTYQDTSGEVTDVYEKSGMSLVQHAKPKKVLVRDGITYKDAKNNRRDWFSMQQVAQVGPDNLLKVHLGEMLHNDGTRLTNVELFIDVLGYHIEIIPGDRVYEWNNPHMVFYTYRITATDSQKYYIGRTRYVTTDGECTEQDLIDDGYYGSGGTKYKNWKKKHSDHLVKQIIGMYTTWGTAVQAEEHLIGELYKTDPNCLNVLPGGVSLSGASAKKPISVRDCPVHGLTKHMGKHCYKCMHAGEVKKKIRKKGNNHNNYILKECAVHGMTKHYGSTCMKCSMKDTYSYGDCLLHGNNVSFKKGSCVACLNSKNIDIITGNCPKHNDTLYVDNVCLLCVFDNNPELKKLLDSKQPPQGKSAKDRFICPVCSGTVSSTVNNIMSTIVELLDDNNCLPAGWISKICTTCASSAQFLNRNPEIVEYLGEHYVSTLHPPLTGLKDPRVFDFHCPVCHNMVASGNVRAFIKRIRRNHGILCHHDLL